MEMVKTKVIILLLCLVSLSSFAQEYRWSAALMDGSRTGCTASTGENTEDSFGVLNNGVYTSPNGRTHSKTSSTSKVAAIVLEAQPAMQRVKEVVGWSETEMRRSRGESVLSNWFTELIMEGVEGLSGKDVQVGICNFGGIRSNMPQGDVILDDILSMFPFKNYLVYLELKGSELMKIFSEMASTRFQAVAGVEILAEDGRLVHALIDGKPLEDDKYYGVATISFLLYGGDSLSLAENAANLNTYQVSVSDAVLAHLSELKKNGKNIVAPQSRYVTVK